MFGSNLVLSELLCQIRSRYHIAVFLSGTDLQRGTRTRSDAVETQTQMNRIRNTNKEKEKRREEKDGIIKLLLCCVVLGMGMGCWRGPSLTVIFPFFFN